MSSPRGRGRVWRRWCVGENGGGHQDISGCPACSSHPRNQGLDLGGPNAPALDLRTLQASLPSLACLAHRVLYGMMLCSRTICSQQPAWFARGPYLMQVCGGVGETISSGARNHFPLRLCLSSWRGSENGGDTHMSPFHPDEMERRKERNRQRYCY